MFAVWGVVEVVDTVFLCLLGGLCDFLWFFLYFWLLCYLLTFSVLCYLFVIIVRSFEVFLLPFQFGLLSFLIIGFITVIFVVVVCYFAARAPLVFTLLSCSSRAHAPLALPS